MFRRTIDGTVHRFDVAGLWGSGNVISEREGLFDGLSTAYSMWDGHALFGPRRPGVVEKYPALLGTISLREFIERFSALGPTCEVFSGAETLGIGCEAACEAQVGLCPGRTSAECLLECAGWPRAITDCLAVSGECDDDRGVCGTLAWDGRAN